MTGADFFLIGATADLSSIVVPVLVSAAISALLSGQLGRIRPERNKIEAETQKLDAERNLLITQVSDKAVRTVEQRYEERLRSIADQLEAARGEVARLKEHEAELVKRIVAIEENAKAEEQSLRHELDEARREYSMLLAEYTALRAVAKTAGILDDP
jgi:predicted  nucleic acid-binding Zn-ribbon protein